MKRILEFLFGPRLRNKSGGMAWVRCEVPPCGAQNLIGAAVKTVSVNAEGFWSIEPSLSFIATAPVRFGHNGRRFSVGDVVLINLIHDKALEPWKDDGVTREEVNALYEPSYGRPIPIVSPTTRSAS